MRLIGHCNMSQDFDGIDNHWMEANEDGDGSGDDEDTRPTS